MIIEKRYTYEQLRDGEKPNLFKEIFLAGYRKLDGRIFQEQSFATCRIFINTIRLEGIFCFRFLVGLSLSGRKGARYFSGSFDDIAISHRGSDF